jgi:hypothetical protein
MAYERYRERSRRNSAALEVQGSQAEVESARAAATSLTWSWSALCRWSFVS